MTTSVLHGPAFTLLPTGEMTVSDIGPYSSFTLRHIALGGSMNFQKSGDATIVGTHGISIRYTSFMKDERRVTDRNPVGSDDEMLHAYSS